jgi:hypothetical protein
MVSVLVAGLVINAQKDENTEYPLSIDNDWTSLDLFGTKQILCKT